MNTKATLILNRLHRAAELAALFGVLFTLAGFLGRYHWFLDLFTHFKFQLALCFTAYAALEGLFRNTRRAIASLVFAAVNALPIVLLMLSPAPQADIPHPATLRILQANILTTNTNSPALLDLIARENPDVIVLQEPGIRWQHDLAPLTNAYPVFAVKPREDNFGAAIYCKPTFSSAEILLLNDSEQAPSTRARITAANGRTLTVVGTHPLAPYNGYTWRGRNAYTLQLAHILSDTEGPRVVTGDFNNTPWAFHFKAFMAISGLRNSMQGHIPQFTWPTFNHPLARIPLDHCFHSADVRIIDRRLGPDIGSDHLPLIIDIAF